MKNEITVTTTEFQDFRECAHSTLHPSSEGFACWSCNYWFGPDDMVRYLNALARIARRDQGDMGEIAYAALRWDELEDHRDR